MKRVIDQSILMIYCMASFYMVAVNTLMVAAFLAALIYVGVQEFLDRRKVRWIISLIWLVAAFCSPELWLFSPLILYSMLSCRAYPLAVVMWAGCMNYCLPDRIHILIFLGLGCMLAALIQYQTQAYEILDARFRKIRDDSAELNLLLKEKNQNLLEKQDYEIYTATLKERNRIAREIHDNVGHMLSRSILMVGALKAVNSQDTLKKPLGQLEDTLNAAMTSVRESVHDLHDESINLKEVLETLAGEFTFCPVYLEYDLGYDVPREIKYSFITIVKEALNNVIRHSNATCVKILVREHPGLYQLVIEDNGTAMTKKQMERIVENPGGMGIRNMKERIENLHGNVQLKADDGFRIFITVPKREV